MEKYKIAYILSDLKMVGPTNQTFNIISNSKYKNESIVITLFGEPKDTMIEKYKKEKINIECLNLNRNLYFLYAKKLKQILEKYDIKLIHSYGIKADYLSYKAVKSTSIEHIITLRNYPKEDILTRMKYIPGKIALSQHLHVLKQSKNVVCCSKSIYDKMKKDYPNKNFKYIQNGVDTKFFKALEKEEKDRKKINIKFNLQDKIFICTNSFIPRKRIEETIKIFNLIEEENKKLLLLGDGLEFEKIKSNYENNKDIFFIGKTNKILDYLQISDYFISSSESEGLPNAVLEALSCEVPVILSDIVQHKEIENEIKNIGIIYKLGCPEEIVKKYVKVGSEQYKIYKDNTKKIQESVFTMKKMSEKYVKIYEKVGDIFAK